MIFLIDHNLGGHAEILLGNIASQGWVDRILEILLDIENWMGVGRLFIP
ncbi:hypothetical protein [Coleofasciculus sp.]